MKAALSSLPPAPVKGILIGIYLIALAMALIPWLYLSVSGSSTLILGIPAAIFYWMFNAFLVGAALTFLYFYEDARGELDEVLASC